jgi:3'(2'), 5'-bisphosphate nucleotidase
LNLECALRAAERAVLLAADVCRGVRARGRAFVAHAKPDTSPVTLADFASQAVITRVLLGELGDDLGGYELCAEEDAGWLGDPGQSRELELVTEAAQVALPEIRSGEVVELVSRSRQEPATGSYWLVDPLDGTKGYLRGGQYCVAVALVESERPVMGVLGCPALGLASPASGPAVERLDTQGSLYAAALGGGVTERRCVFGDAQARRLPRLGPASRAEPVLASSFEPSHRDEGALARIREAMGARDPLVRVDSALKYVLVARGDADAYLRLPPCSRSTDYAWDHAAGSLIASEAGANVTHLGGQPLEFGRGRCLGEPGGIVAARPEVHGRLLEALARLGIG